MFCATRPWWPTAWAEPIFQENALILTASLEETCLPALANACLREEERWVGEGVAYLVEHGAPEEETLAQEYSDAGNMAALGMDDLCFLPSLRAEEMNRIVPHDGGELVAAGRSGSAGSQRVAGRHRRGL